MRRIAISLAALAAGTWAGCVNYDKPVAPAPELTPEQRSFEAVWGAATEVLRECRFSLTRQDRRSGVITTALLTGRYVAEFWRKDAATATDVAEGTIQTVYRLATVTVEPVPEANGTFGAKVEVEAARSDLPSVQISSTGEAYSLYTMTGGRNRWLMDFGQAAGESAEPPAARRGGAEPEGRAATQKAGPQGPWARWQVPLGRDAGLEKRIASEIAALAARRLGGKN